MNCYEDYTCPPNVIKREDVPVSVVKGCQWRCASRPKAKQDVAGSARGDSVRAEGRKEAPKLNEEGQRLLKLKDDMGVVALLC